MERRSKQIIVMRKDLNMRKGKMIAQGAHASMGAVLKQMNMHPTEEPNVHERTLYLYEGSPLMDWLEGQFTKICVSVDSEKELLEVHEKALSVGLVSCLITDSGLTEFNGVPTKTCCAIGPAWEEELQPITGHLKLL